MTDDVTIQGARGPRASYPRGMSSPGGSGRGPDDPWTTYHLPFDIAAPRAARRYLLEDLTRAGLREAVVVDAQVVLAELVNNGVEHGLSQVAAFRQPGRGRIGEQCLRVRKVHPIDAREELESGAVADCSPDQQ